jgi:hypothetical protein
MAVNLIRGARVFFTTVLDGNNKIAPAIARSAADTFELQPLDGMSFSQNTTLDTVTLNEAGSTPSRGQRSFATALEAGDWSISTYVRPKMFDGTTVAAGLDAGDFVRPEEACLWNAMFGYTNVDLSSTTALTNTTDDGKAYIETASTGSSSVPSAQVRLTQSNRNQLLRFGLIIVFDDTTVLLHNCVIDQASVDFGIDQIGTIAWTGKVAEVEVRTTATTATTTGTSPGLSGAFSGLLSGAYKPKDATCKYITNRLSTVQLSSTANKYGQGASAVDYTFAITGGNITFANNVTYLTPAVMGTVNKPIDYFVGTRAVSGSLTAYLRTGSTNTAQLLSTLLTQANTYDQNQFTVKLGMGGSVTAPTSTTMENKVIFELPSAMLQIPQISTEQVISTSINFTAQGANAGTYDIEQNNEATITYYSSPAV